MKKLVVLPLLFVFTFGLTAGFTLTFNEEAQATPTCSYYCQYDFYCTLETGPLCPYGRPYYAYRYSSCVGGPFNCPYEFEFFGCWRGTGKCMPIPAP